MPTRIDRDDVAAIAKAAVPEVDPESRTRALRELERALFGDHAAALAGGASEMEDEPVPSIGRYVLLEAVGHGGMATVLRAYDPKLRREVALKRLDARRSHEATGRLLREAQAMARLTHRSVVAVYDVELDGREVVLVMEYVCGQTLREWLAASRRGWREIVAAFHSAGEGLAAAHRVGIVHRDFKPSNVMVSAEGAVKVTDFGLAKGIEHASGDELLSKSSTEQWRDEVASPLTRSDTVMGTPRYMAPEQHVGSADERADQYAFCVALWEALTGDPPFCGTTLQELASAKLRGPPAWPASNNVPQRIVVALRRGLAAHSDDRFPTMGALLDRLAERSGRRRALLGAAATTVVFGAAAIGIWRVQESPLCSGGQDQLAGAWDDDQRARVRDGVTATNLPYAHVALAWIGTQLDDYATAWVEAHREACEATSIRGEQSSEVMDLRIGCLRRARQDLAAATALLARADDDVVDNAVALVGGLPPLDRCADIDALRLAVAPPATPELRATVDDVRETVASARALLDAGRYADARTELDAWSARLPEIDYPVVRAEWRLARGRALGSLGDNDGAERVLREGLAEAMGVGAWEQAAMIAATLALQVGGRQARLDEGAWLGELASSLALGSQADTTVSAMVLVARARVATGRSELDDAEAMLLRAADLRRERFGPEHPLVASVEVAIADVLVKRGRYDEAESLVQAVRDRRRRILGSDHPDVASTTNVLGSIMIERGRYAEAEALYREALASWERVLGPDHRVLVHGSGNLGLALFHQARHAEATALHRRAVERLRVELGPEHRDTLFALNNLGLSLYGEGELEEAEAVHRNVLAVREEVLGAEHPDVATSAANLAIVLLERERWEESEAATRKALANWEARHGPDHPRVGIALHNLGLAVAGQGRAADAEPLFRRAEAIVAAKLDPSHPTMGRVLHSLGLALLDQGKRDEARAVLERAWPIRSTVEDDPQLRAQTAFALARASEGPAARRLLERAKEEAEKAGPRAKDLLRRIERY